jgi:hypothetical protein
MYWNQLILEGFKFQLPEVRKKNGVKIARFSVCSYETKGLFKHLYFISSL